MIIDTTNRKPVVLKKVIVPRKPAGGMNAKMAVGDNVEVEVKRGGDTLYKGK